MSNQRNPNAVATVLLAVALLVASAGGVAAGNPSAPSATCGVQDYEVTFTDVQIDTWRLIDVTVTNATIREVHVTNATTGNDTIQNVTLENVTLREFFVANATLSNVSADELVVRNRSILDVPGAGLIDSEFSNRTIERHVLKAVTIEGLVVERMEISTLDVADGAFANESTDRPNPDPSSAAPDEADVVIRNSTVASADVGNTTGVDWAIENTSADNRSLPTSSDERASPSGGGCLG